MCRVNTDVGGQCTTSGDCLALDPNNAFSWVCARNGQRAEPVRMNRVCTNQYGPGTFALPGSIFNAGSWRCYR